MMIQTTESTKVTYNNEQDSSQGGTEGEVDGALYVKTTTTVDDNKVSSIEDSTSGEDEADQKTEDLKVSDDAVDTNLKRRVAADK